MRSSDSHLSSRPCGPDLGLGFLLSLGALPIAGCPAEDDEDTNSSGSPTTNNTANTVSATGDSSGGNSMSATETSASDDTAGTNQTDSADTGTSIGTVTMTTGLDSGTGGLPDACTDIAIPPGCTAYKDKLIECYPRYATYYESYDLYCACNVSYYSPMYGAGCGQAQEDYYACLGALSCEMLMSKEPQCEAEGMAIDTECFGGATSTSDDAGTTNDDQGSMTDPATDT